MSDQTRFQFFAFAMALRARQGDLCLDELAALRARAKEMPEDDALRPCVLTFCTDASRARFDRDALVRAGEALGYAVNLVTRRVDLPRDAGRVDIHG